MKIINVIEKFNVTNGEDFQLYNQCIPGEVHFPHRSVKQQISIDCKVHDIAFDLIYYYAPRELKQFKLGENDLLNKGFLRELSRTFSFRITNHPRNSSLSIGVIPDKSTWNGETCYGIIKKEKGKVFFMIFSRRGDTDFEDNIIYIHGIWEVGIPKDFESKLFEN